MILILSFKIKDVIVKVENITFIVDDILDFEKNLVIVVQLNLSIIDKIGENILNVYNVSGV